MRSPGSENGDPAAVRKSEDQFYVALSDIYNSGYPNCSENVRCRSVEQINGESEQVAGMSVIS